MCKLKSNIIVFLCFLGAIEGYLYAESSIALQTSADAICTANPFITFKPEFSDDGYFGNSLRFIYAYSADGQSWSTFFTGNSISYGYTQRPAVFQEGWYRVSVAREDEMDIPDRWLVSDPVYMQKIEGGCTPFKITWPDEISENVCPQGTILFREDFGGNDPSDPTTSPTRMTTMSSRYRQVFNVLSWVSSGLFVVAKHGWKNNWESSTTANMFSQWFIQDDHTYPNDYARGYLLEVDGIGGNDAFYTTTFPVCHELDLSFSAYVANVLEPGHNFAQPKVRFLIQDESTNDTIWEQSSGAIEPAPGDYLQYGVTTTMSAPWHLVGASFHVPEGVSLIRLSIFNDENSGMGNDFAMDDIEIRLCNPVVSILSDHEVCMDSSYVFESSVTTDGGFKPPYNYLWQYAPDSLEFNSDGWTNVVLGETLSFDSVKLTDDGWYRLCVTSADVDVETERYCRAMSEPFHLKVNECIPPCPEIVDEFDEITVCDTLMPYFWHDTIFYKDTTYEIMYKNKYGCDIKRGVYTLHTELCCPDPQYVPIDTVVCDTLMPFLWRGVLFEEPTTQEVMETSSRGCDSILHIYTLNTELCCPDPQYVPIDTVVCDTLMPFLWRGVLFEEPATREVMETSPRGCDSILYSYTLDTIHCERLYPIIVNKYNWQLLCDNVALRRLFPDRMPAAFQWYKNEYPIQGATEDDYAEQNELHGIFQLRVTLDQEQIIWSNILEIFDSIEETPVQVHIYNSRGEEVSEAQVTHGVYLYRYQQGDRIWTEKRLIP